MHKRADEIAYWQSCMDSFIYHFFGDLFWAVLHVLEQIDFRPWNPFSADVSKPPKGKNTSFWFKVSTRKLGRSTLESIEIKVDFIMNLHCMEHAYFYSTYL